MPLAAGGRITFLGQRKIFIAARYLMSVDQKRNQSLFRKLSQLGRKLTSDPEPEHVHQFRTTTRRIETLFKELVPKPDRNERKLLKQLAKIRKRAGRVRDLDVQMAALRTLKIGRDGDEKRTLFSALAGERGRYAKKLAALFDKDSLRELRKRLRRAAKNSQLCDNKLEPAAKALRMFARLAREQGEVTEAVLHQYRLRCKRIRYLAEMEGKQPLAQAVVQQLKTIQDAVGEWHDWDTLAARAEALFSNVPSAPIITALRAVRHTKLVEALHVTQAAKTRLLEMQQRGGGKKPARFDTAQPSSESSLASAASA